MAKKPTKSPEEQEDEIFGPDEPTPYQPATTSKPKTTAPQAEPDVRVPHLQILGEQVSGKNETRLFQTAPHEKTWLTKAQAAEQGRYWKDDD